MPRQECHFDQAVNRALGYKITVKPFQPQQTWTATIGYCTKDALETHCRVEAKGITAQELTNGKQDREGRTEKFTKDHQVIHLRKFIDEMYKFRRPRCFLLTVCQSSF